MSLEKTINTRATSGTISNAFRSGYKVQISWSVNSQNIANNTSNVTVKAQLVSTGSAYTISSSATKNGSLAINGTTYNFTFSASLSGNQTKTVFTKTVDVPHNSDGTKTLSMSTTLGINVTLSGTYWGNVSASGSGSLNTIPRTSNFTLSSNSINLGSPITVNISKASSSFAHKVYYKFGSIYVNTNSGTATSYSFTPSLSDANQIPNSTSGSATVIVETYTDANYGTKIGSTSKTFTVNVPSSVKPSLSSVTATLVGNGVDTSFGYIKGKSKCTLTINGATGSHGSTIKSYNISGGGFSSTASSFTTGVLNSSGSITFTATVTDSRGRTSDAKTVSISVQDYSNPVITEFNVIRCLSDATASDDGTYVKVWVRYDYTTLGGKNTITSKVEFKPTSSTTWTNAGAISSGSYIVTGSNGIATDSSYDVRITVTDKFDSVTKAMIVPTAFVTMDIKRGGKGIAFGKTSETDNLLDIGMNAKLGGTTTIDGDVRLCSPNRTWNGEFIKRYEGDQYGMGVAIQTGGKIAIGGGESAITFMNGDGDHGRENGYLTGDGNVYLVSNLNNGYSSKKHLCFANSGQLSFSDSSCHIQLPSNGGSWLNGATNGNIRGSQQSTGSYHPIISQTTSSGHKISLGGLGDNFGFHIYDKGRTENGIDKYFRYNLANKQIDTDMRMVLYDDWYYTTGNTGWYNSTHQGGWYMKDSSWVRSYNDKNIYTGGRIKTVNAMETRYIDAIQNSNLDISANGTGTIFFNMHSGSGVNLNLNKNWSGSSGSEPSFYNAKGNGWGYIGNSGWSFYRVYGAGGSVSDRNKKYHITKALEEEQYDNLKSINIYNYRTISTQETDIREIAENVLKGSGFKNEDGTYKTEGVEWDGKVYEELDVNLTQEEIKEERIKQIIEKNPQFGQVKRQDLMLGAMVDELPTEVTFYDNEGGDGKAVDMYSYTTMVAGATKHLINKVETLEKENEELRNRLDKLEELLNGIINEG